MKKMRRRRRSRKLSHIGMLFLGILAIVLIGDIVGAVMYLRQSPEVQEGLVQYVAQHADSQRSFFQILSGQMRYQLTIWGLGATIIGNLVNGFLIFTRGVSAGFNLTFLIREVTFSEGADLILIWLFQHTLVLVVTIINVYFSVKFAYVVLRSVIKKQYKWIKKYARIYVNQLVVVVILTIFTSLITAAITPDISEHLNSITEPYETMDEVES